MTATVPWVIIQVEQRIVLYDVRWSTFERLLADQCGRRSPRFTYDRGRLEIMTTSREHEVRNQSLASVVEIVTEELDIEAWNLGQSTFKRDDIEQGFEPDTCFFFHSRPTIRSTIECDPATDSPPDLVIEIDLSSSSLSRFPIYAGFGFPEVWRDHDGKVVIWRLGLGEYVETGISGVLPPLTGEILTRFLDEGQSMRPLEWRRSVRAWAGEHAARQLGG